MKSEKRRNKGISIHVPSWGTTELDKLNFKFVLFQSTFPRGERQIHFGICDHSKKFQSTFPRGERPGDRSGNIRGDENFNPRSLVGNDGKTATSQTLPRDFNPRSLVGNDDSYNGDYYYQSISIHVPSWGTTMAITEKQQRFIISIHVPSWGTTKCGTTWTGKSVFQSTFPRGERPNSGQVLLQPYGISIHVPSWGTTERFD